MEGRWEFIAVHSSPPASNKVVFAVDQMEDQDVVEGFLM